MTDLFRRNIRLLRAQLDKSAKEISIEMGFKPHRLADLEYGKGNRGMPTLEEMRAIAGYYKVQLSDLLDRQVTLVFSEPADTEYSAHVKWLLQVKRFIDEEVRKALEGSS